MNIIVLLKKVKIILRSGKYLRRIIIQSYFVALLIIILFSCLCQNSEMSGPSKNTHPLPPFALMAITGLIIIL